VIRLGLRRVKGLSQAGGQRIVEACGERVFEDAEDLARRARLDRRDLDALARAGALAGLSGHRRHALWTVLGIDRPPPVLEGARLAEPLPGLEPPGEGEEIVADYASLGLTLGRHPLALLRGRLARLRALRAVELESLPSGRPVHVAGIVTCRQRPATARGVTFVTLEDETGCVNVVVWAATAERQRRELLGASLMGVAGRLERHAGVTHVIAGRLYDHSALLGRLQAPSRDFH
jgi:error-prone DNA polymerase